MCLVHAKSREKKTKGKVWKAAKIESRGKSQELPRRKNTRYNKIKPPYVYLSYDVIHLILIPFSERQVFGHAYAKTIHHATFFFGQRIFFRPLPRHSSALVELDLQGGFGDGRRRRVCPRAGGAALSKLPPPFRCLAIAPSSVGRGTAQNCDQGLS